MTFKEKYLRDRFDIEGLRKSGFWRDIAPDDWQGMENRIVIFFGLKNISQYDQLPPNGPGIFVVNPDAFSPN